METGDECIVEKVLDKRMVRGKVEYLLKWRGFGKEENVWETVDNLKLFTEFEKQWEETKKADMEAKKKQHEKRGIPSENSEVSSSVTAADNQSTFSSTTAIEGTKLAYVIKQLL